LKVSWQAYYTIVQGKKANPLIPILIVLSIYQSFTQFYEYSDQDSTIDYYELQNPIITNNQYQYDGTIGKIQDICNLLVRNIQNNS